MRVRSPLAVSDTSQPEPDLAVVAHGDYLEDHPRTALLVVEVADTKGRRFGADMDIGRIAEAVLQIRPVRCG